MGSTERIRTRLSRIVDFLLQSNDQAGTVPVEARITIVAFHIITLATLLAMPWNIYVTLADGNYFSFTKNVVFVVLMILSQVFFFRFRSIRITRFLMGAAVILLLLGEMLVMNTSRGMGFLYFVAGFSLLYFILGFRLGLAFVAFFITGSALTLLLGTFGPRSILQDPEVRASVMVILGTGALIGGIAVWCQHHLVAQLTRLAYRDAVTDLPNRTYLMEALNRRMALPHAAHRPFSLIAVKLHNFSQVNASFGTQTSDRILRDCGTRIRGVIPRDALLGRFSGTLFLSICDVSQAADIQRLATSILRSLEKGFALEEGETAVPADLAVCTYPKDGQSSQRLMASLMATLGRLPKGRGQVLVYDDETFLQDQQRQNLMNDLRKALQRQELSLAWHPKVRFADGRCEGAEILLRWNHPLLGNVSPAVFIPLAEETGLIEAITQWVIGRAMGELVAINAALGQQHGLVHAINLSPLDLNQPGFDINLQRLMTEGGIDPRSLELEITEGMLMADNPTVQRMLESLTSLGCRLAIDDFGTGYSSLSYLHTLRVNNLKIDQSFVRQLNTSSETNPIVSAIISMARALDLDITAEGVETEEQARWLRDHGCTSGQGWLWARPMPLADYLVWLKNTS